jgi:hypothetical protein
MIGAFRSMAFGEWRGFDKFAWILSIVWAL